MGGPAYRVYMGLGSNIWQYDYMAVLYTRCIVPGKAGTGNGRELLGDQPAIALVYI